MPRYFVITRAEEVREVAMWNKFKTNERPPLFLVEENPGIFGTHHKLQARLLLVSHAITGGQINLARSLFYTVQVIDLCDMSNKA